MRIIDIDSHSNPETKDVAIDEEYTHIGPFYNVEGDGTRRTVLNDKVIQIFRNEEKGIAYNREINFPNKEL